MISFNYLVDLSCISFANLPLDLALWAFASYDGDLFGDNILILPYSEVTNSFKKLFGPFIYYGVILSPPKDPVLNLVKSYSTLCYNNSKSYMVYIFF